MRFPRMQNLCDAPEIPLVTAPTPHARPLWSASIDFCVKVIGDKRPSNPTTAVLFGLQNTKTLMSEPARAFLRHAVGVFYAHAARTADQGTVFYPQFALHRALTNFRAAVLRYGAKMRLHHTRRIHTNLHDGVPDAARTRFPTLIDVDTSCSFSLTPEFIDAVDKAEKAANDLRDSLNGSNRHVRRRTT